MAFFYTGPCAARIGCLVVLMRINRYGDPMTRNRRIRRMRSGRRSTRAARKRILWAGSLDDYAGAERWQMDLSATHRIRRANLASCALYLWLMVASRERSKRQTL